ncbi:TIGR01777 family protein [Humibacillus sp. DSM 29435]|uniref:TIGR01777 family oxidoreductase n=1 Tax=Humibacillus sp. DSM 29435 TaxID=1869167 RepID=UPI000872DC13|nr:TIGR01777 family oxidoreductase [Humibacillus sp. DSM 29435]OFE16336.1 TIGR01777 family protein [Humibacillus sp. DSM 29435]
MGKRVAVTGSTGLIGDALCRHLVARGDSLVRLVRRPTEAADEREWDPAQGLLEPTALEGVDALVNLGGVGIGDKRWTEEHKKAVEQSRVDATDTVSRALAQHLSSTGRRIRLVSGSAVGFYGDRGDEVLTESSPAGDDFLAGVVTRWEAAADPARDAGLDVALVRTGLVMSRRGGAFEPILRLARLGLGGPLGSGKQWFPWITLVDEVRAIVHLIDHPDLAGPFNLSAPGEARQKEVATALGQALSRPAILPAPRFAIRVAIGEFADSALASQRMHPVALTASGFTFEHPDLAAGVTWLVKH